MKLAAICTVLTLGLSSPAFADVPPDGLAPYDAIFLRATAAASSGRPADLIQLGECYENALGVDQDLVKALALYRRAAEAGDPDGMWGVARLLGHPDLPGENNEDRAPWLQLAAESGLAEAQYALDTREWLERAAAQGHVKAAISLAQKMAGDKSIPRQDLLAMFAVMHHEDPRAEFWYRTVELLSQQKGGNRSMPPPVSHGMHEAALTLDLEDQPNDENFFFMMALAGLSGDWNALQSSENGLNTAIFAKLEPRAAGGDVLAACNLGYLLRRQDTVASARWYGAAAGHGSARGAYHLGQLMRAEVPYETGTAAGWLYRSALQGYPPAQAVLGRMFLRGDGVARDEEQALTWLRPAAAYGHPEAQHDLALLYEAGQVVGRDMARAIHLMGLAAADGSRGFEPRKGLASARTWLERIAEDVQYAEATERAINPQGKPGTKWLRAGKSLRRTDEAPMDCLGRPVVW